MTYVNTRWLAWCRATGRDPDLAAKVAPGGRHFGAWVDARWAEWDRLNGREPGGRHSEADHDSFDSWLTALVEAQGKGMEGR